MSIVLGIAPFLGRYRQLTGGPVSTPGYLNILRLTYVSDIISVPDIISEILALRLTWLLILVLRPT